MTTGDRRRGLWVWSAATLGPASATGVGLAIGQTKTTAVALVYLLAVLAVATWSGLAAGIGAALLSFVGLNYFFTPPVGMFSVGKTDDLIALFVFLVVGIVVSSLVTIGSSFRARASQVEREAETLYAISSRLAEADEIGVVLADVGRGLMELFHLARCEIEIEGEQLGTAGEGAGGRPSVDVPVSTGGDHVGWIRMFPSAPFGEPERRIAVILAGQIALAYRRASLAREAREARVSAEANALRRALVSAVSHDFRTPLASIKASITALLPDPTGVDPGDASELLTTALEETERLDRLVANLLDLARMRAGTLVPEREEVPVEPLIEDALASLRGPLSRHRVAVQVREDVPPLLADPVQVGQVLRNLLENAARFASPGTEIRVVVSRWKGWVEIRVADRGPGIDPEDKEAIFEEFYRGTDAGRGGAGIGLAIARTIVRAHGGQIWVEVTPGGGATIALRLRPANGSHRP